MRINPNLLLISTALSGCRRAFFVMFFFSLFVNVLVLAGPMYMLQVFDRVLTSQSTDTLLMLTIICVVALFMMALLDIVRSRIGLALSAWLDRLMASAVFDGSVHAALGASGHVSTQGLRDIRTVRGFLSSAQVLAFFDAPWVPFFVVVLFVLHPWMGTVAIGGAVVLFTIALLNEWLTRGPASQESGASAAAMALADAAVRNAESVSAMGMLPALRGRWREATAMARANQVVSERRSSTLVALSKFVRMVLQMLILGVGASLALSGDITPGAMIAGSILLSRALAPVEQAIGAWRTMVGARQAYQRVRGQLAIQPVPPESMELPAPAGNLAVSGVSYMIDGHREPILRNISFAAEAGDVIGLIGPSGSGKSTLAKLLLGNLAPKTGHVRLDGMDVSAWSSEQLGPHCGYLPQDIELFAGSVKDNIARMGEPEPERVVAAALLAGCHELILSLPGGYDANVGERGKALSGGTRQRVALARAVYGSPRLVILDEPNSNLDAKGEAALKGAIKALKQQQVTVVIIGHRSSTLDFVDKVLVVDGGNMVSFGPVEAVKKELGIARVTAVNG